MFAFPYFGLLNTSQYGLVLLAIVLSLVFHDMQYGPQAALIAESFGTNIRYSGAGIGYQLASVIAGGPAPLIAAAILKNTGSSTGISWYIIGCCVLAFVALLLMPRRSTAQATDVYDAAVEKVLPSRRGPSVSSRRPPAARPPPGDHRRVTTAGCTAGDHLSAEDDACRAGDM